MFGKAMRTSKPTAALAALVATLAACGRSPPPQNSIVRLPAYQSPALLQAAWALPVAKRYGPAGFISQPDPSTCGPTSVADVLRSQGASATPQSVLRGSGVRSYFGIIPGGLTLDEEARLVRLNTGQPVKVLRGLSLSAFRAEMARSNDPTRRYIVNFTREPLFGRGHGHFSPVLGYLPKQDLVFVGDVNGDYEPWLVPTARLYAAQATVDPTSHAPRGLLVIGPATPPHRPAPPRRTAPPARRRPSRRPPNEPTGFRPRAVETPSALGEGHSWDSPSCCSLTPKATAEHPRTV
jgi:hypothetical protein